MNDNQINGQLGDEPETDRDPNAWHGARAILESSDRDNVERLVNQINPVINGAIVADSISALAVQIANLIFQTCPPEEQDVACRSVGVMVKALVVGNERARARAPETTAPTTSDA